MLNQADYLQLNGNKPKYWFPDFHSASDYLKK